ncbi:MAG: hypothetical protein NTV10_05080 [Methanoregula sp.]|jgi:hypothetical protein|nr:hypothetical protein [Methanoregula sp.]
MARLNDDAQWIVLMGFIVSFSLFFLGIVINQSTVVGQTTAEGVLEFPKNDILDIRSEVLQSSKITVAADFDDVKKDISSIALSRKNAIVSFRVTQAPPGSTYTKIIDIHYNNGVTAYNETTNY